VNRVVVVGAPGCGKTTVAGAIGRALDLPHTELDSLWWEPNWVEAGAEAFTERASAVAATARWVVDGNYFSVGAETTVWPRADTIVWLDLPRHIAVPRVLRRSLRRATTGVELWNGNRERLMQLWRPDSIVRFAYVAWPKYGARYRQLIASGDYDYLNWVVLPSPAAVRSWLGGLTLADR